MIELIVNNLMRRIGRTLLTALGVGLGVATIVALLSVSDGLTQTAAGFAHLGGSDLGVFQAGVSDPTVSLLPTSLTVARLERNPDVASATPLLLIVGKVRADPSAFVFGADPAGFFAAAARVRRRRPAVGVADRGRRRPRRDAAPAAGVGACVVDGHRFTVSGVYHSGIADEDAGRRAAAGGRAGAHRAIRARRPRSRSSWRPSVERDAATRSIQRQFPHTHRDRAPARRPRAPAPTAPDPQRDARDRDHRARDRRDQRHQHDGDVGARAPGRAGAAEHDRLERRARRGARDRRGRSASACSAPRSASCSACSAACCWSTLMGVGALRLAVDHRLGARARPARRDPDRRARRPLPRLARHADDAAAEVWRGQAEHPVDDRHHAVGAGADLRVVADDDRRSSRGARAARRSGRARAAR